MNIFEAQDKFPVYIHTQPWSWKAIFLYLSLGFKLQKHDTFSHYENEYHQAMAEIKRLSQKSSFHYCWNHPKVKQIPIYHSKEQHNTQNRGTQ